MSIKPQSNSPIPQTLHPAEPVRTSRFPLRRKTVSKPPAFKIDSSVKVEESCPEGSLAFLRRYGKTYSPYGNLTPVMRKFGKTYSSRGNLKLSGSSSNQSSQSQSDEQKVSHNETVVVDNAPSSQTLMPNSKFYTLKKVSGKNDMTYSKKVIIKNHPSMLGSGSRERDIIELATRNLKLPCNKSTKKMIVLNNSSSGKPVVTLYLVPNSEATTSVSNDSSRDVTSAATSAVDGKASSKYQPVLVDKNCATSGSIILLDQTNSDSLGVMYKDPVSERNDTLSASAGKEDPQRNTVANKISGLDTVALQSEKSILDAPKQLKQKDILPVSVTREEIHSDAMSYSDTLDVQPQNNVLNALKSIDSSNNGTKEYSVPAKKSSISDISSNAPKLLESKKKVKDMQKELPPFMKSDSVPIEIDKNLAHAIKDISAESDEHSLELENSNSCSKLIISDDKKLTSKQKDNCVKWSHSHCPQKKKLKDKSSENDAVLKRKKKKEKEKQVIKKIKKLKLKPVQKDPPGLEDLNFDSSPVDNKNAKKMNKKKKISEQKKVSKKERLLNSKKKGKISNLKKLNKKSKKKAKISTQFLSNIRKDVNKVKSLSLPKLEKSVPLVANEEKSEKEESETVAFDGMPVLEDATKMVPLPCDDFQTMPVLQESVKSCTITTESYTLEKSGKLLGLDSAENKISLSNFQSQDLLTNSTKISQSFITRQNNPVTLYDTVKDLGHFDSSNTHNINLAHLKPLTNVSATKSDCGTNFFLSLLPSDIETEGKVSQELHLAEPQANKPLLLSNREYAIESKMAECDALSGLSSVDEANCEKPISSLEHGPSAVMCVTENTDTDVTKLNIMRKKKMETLKLSPERQKGKTALSELSNEAKKRKLKLEKNSTDGNVGKPKLSTETQVVKPKLSTDTQEGKPKLSTDTQVVKPKLSTETQVVKPKLSTETQVVKPKLSTETQVVKPKLSTETQVVKPKLSTETQVVKPKLSTDTQVVKPKLSTDTQVVKPKLSTDTQVVKPKLSTDTQVVKPKLSTDTQVVKPKLSTDTQVVKPKLSTDTQVVKPKLSTDTQVVKPKLSTDTQVVKPKLSTDTQVVKPKLSTDTQVVKPKLSTATQVVKPKLSTATQVVKPKLSTDTQVVKPKLSTETQVVKPKLSTETQVVKPKLSTETQVVKPKLSTETQVVKPKLSTDTQVVKPKLSTETQVGKPKSPTDTQVVKPKSPTDTQVVKPKPPTDTQVVKPKPPTDTQVVKPKPPTDTQVVKPKPPTDTQVVKPKPPTDTQVGKPKLSTDKHVGKPKSPTDKHAGKLKLSSESHKPKSSGESHKPKSSGESHKPKSSGESHKPKSSGESHKPKSSGESHKPKSSGESHKPKSSGESHKPKSSGESHKPKSSGESHAGKPKSSGESHAGKPKPSTEPHAGKPKPSTEPHAGKPKPSTEPHAGKPKPSTEPHAGKPKPSTDGLVCKPSLSVDAQLCMPTPSPDALVRKPTPSPDAQVCKPTPSLDTNMGKPELSTEGEEEKLLATNQQLSCKPLNLSGEAGDVRCLPNFPFEVKGENLVNLSSCAENIKSEPPALLRALKLVKKIVKSPKNDNSEQMKMVESEFSDSSILNPLSQMKTLSSMTIEPSRETSDISNIQTTENSCSSPQIFIQRPVLSMLNVSSVITSTTTNSDCLDAKECVSLEAISTNSTDILNSICKTSILNENEISATDNALSKNSQSPNASLSKLELFSSSGSVSSVSTQRNDCATLSKSPSVSLSDTSVRSDATPTTAEHEDESSNLHLYLSSPELDSETERKKMFKKRNRKTKSAARFCFHCKTQIDAKSLSQNLVKQCRCQNCCQNSPSSLNTEAKLSRKLYSSSEKNLSTDRHGDCPEISSRDKLMCSVCHRSFTHPRKLRAHMRWHLGRKPHHCSLCGKKFLQKAHLLGHMRSHRGEGPYKCNICKKTFQSVTNLCVHLRLCTKEKLYKCPDCPRKFTQSEHLADHQSKNGHLSSLQIEDLDNLRSQNENNDICDSNETCVPSVSSSSLYSCSSESLKTLSTIRQEKRQSRMRMLQRHLAGEEAVDVGIEQANKVASTCNNESQDPVSTLAPKLAENNKDLFEQAQAPVAEPVSHNLPQIESQMMALENDHSANDVDMDLKVNHSFSLDIGDFQAITSGESMQEVHDPNASKIDFIMTDPDTEMTPSGQELLLSDLPPPLLSPENVSSTSSTTLVDKTLALPLKTEEPPLLPKVLSVCSLGFNNETQKTFTSDLFNLGTDGSVNNSDKGEEPASVPPLCPDHEISAVQSAGDSAGKEIEILVKKEVPDEKSTKEWEDLEKTDDLTSDTFHEQERVIFLPTNGQKISVHSRSVHLVDWPRTIVQCSVEEQPDDIDPIQESKSSSGQSQGTWSVKEKSNEANCKMLCEEKENGETTKKRKLSVEEENSGTCKYSNWEESNILSLTCLESPPSSNPAKKHCPDSEKMQPIKIEAHLEKPVEIKQEPYSSINDDNFITKDSNESPLKNISLDNDSSGSDLQRPKKDSYGMSKRNLSRLPSEPVRYLPKRNYKKPQKYFCDDFDYSISFSSMKPKNSNPVSATTTTGTLTVTVSNLSESQSANRELSEKKNSHQVNKNNDDCSQNNRTKATNNKANENVNNNNNNKSNDINNKKNNNNNNNGSKKSLNPQTKESAEISSPPNVTSSQRSKRKYDMTKRNLKKEMREKSEKMSRDQLTKNFLRLRFNLPESAEEFELQEQYHKKKLLKNATIKKHTVIPKIAKARKSPQTSPKKCSESHYGLVKMAQADQKPFLSAVTTERKILPAPPKTRREELLENLINYSSANFVANDETNNNLSQKNSEELDVRTEPTQLSKLLGSPLAVLPSAAVPNSTLPSSVATVTTHCETPSVTTIATLIPVTSMKTTDNMPIPVTVLANPLPAVTSLENNQFFMGNLPAPLQENAVPDQKPVLSQILPLPEIEQKTESERDFCPVLQIKKEIVTSDDEGYGGKQSDGLSGLRITGVTGGVTTHDTIPINSDAICSNAMSVSSHDPILDANNHQDWSVTRRRPLRCILVQTEDGFGRSEFTFECCELSFSQIPELASHLDSCHK